MSFLHSLSRVKTERVSGMNTSDRIRNAAYAAMFAALLAVCSWITVPGTVPFTMQTFGVFCALLLLGGKLGTCSILLFILLGALGAPVFSGFRGGIGVLAGTTGGYIVGFVFTGLIFWAAVKLCGNSAAVKTAALAAGLAACYAFGTAWFVFLYTKNTAEITFSAALFKCVVPFIIPDCAKLALALWIAPLLRRHIRSLNSTI